MNSRKNSRNQLSAVGKTHMNVLQKSIRPAMLTLGVALALSAVPPLSADTVYVGAYFSPGGAVQVANTATNTVTNLFTISAEPYALTFNGPNDILYTTAQSSTGPNTLSDYNLVTHSNSVLFTLASANVGGFLTLDPGGATVLFGDSGPGLERLNLSTHAVTNVSPVFPQGLAYDAAGHLFAVLGNTELAQINPVSGAVINSITLPFGAYGLAFDPVSGHLFVTDRTGNLPARGLYEIPTDLSSATLVTGGIVAAGLVADGRGDLFIAGGASTTDILSEYTIATHTLTGGPVVFGINDAALPPTTVPPPPPVPEPATLLLLGIGLGTIGILQRRLDKR